MVHTLYLFINLFKKHKSFVTPTYRIIYSDIEKYIRNIKILNFKIGKVSLTNLRNNNVRINFSSLYLG